MLKGLILVLLVLWLLVVIASQNFLHLVYGSGALALVLILAECFSKPD